MKRKDIQKKLEEMDVEVLLADGFEEALLGLGLQFHKAVAVYDLMKCIDILVERDGMSREDAAEYLEFNTLDAYVGEQTPIFMTRLKE